MGYTDNMNNYGFGAKSVTSTKRGNLCSLHSLMLQIILYQTNGHNFVNPMATKTHFLKLPSFCTKPFNYAFKSTFKASLEWITDEEVTK
jgi:hypothetical protein